MKEKIMPPLVLMLISAIVCGLLVLANCKGSGGKIQ